jgi:CelD/BcsL family acetyltransferase involved in cellulose biosynthesis
MWISEPVSQYGDILVDPSAVTEADLASSWDFVRQSFVPDVVLLRKVRDDAAVGRIMDAIGAASSASQLAPYLDLASAPDFDTYETRYSGKARKNRRRLRRRLEEKGRVSFVHLAHGAAAAALARKGVAMKRTWLEAREMIAPAVGDARFEAFFSDFAGEARNGARCRVSAIELDGQPIAVMVALGWAGRLAGHVFAYDIEHEKIGAGVLLLEEVARQALADGYEVLDLLAPADAYKLDWSDSSAMTRDWSISLTLTGGVYRSVYLERLRGPLKRSAAALPPLVRKLVRFGLDRRQRAAGSHSGIK